MVIKKTKNKAYHIGNRLNGNGGNMTATYKIFDEGVEVGFASRQSGSWNAYAGQPLKPILRSCTTLAQLKSLIAEQ